VVWPTEADLGGQDELDCVVRVVLDASQDLRLVLYTSVQAQQAEGDSRSGQEEGIDLGASEEN
jgi:hypothetical protein